MRTLVIAVVLGTLVLGRPLPGHAQPGREFGLGVLSAGANLFYVPAKLLTAVGGLALGGLAGFLTGGDQRAAYGVMVPAATGTFILGPANLAGTEPIQFFGSDYADTPSRSADATEGRGI